MIYNKTHLSRTRVSFDLLDAGGAVYHPNYLILCDRARSEATDHTSYSISSLWKDGLALAVREIQSEYYRPIKMAEDITILTELKEFSGTSLFVQQRIVLTKDLPELDLKEPFFPGPVEIKKGTELFELSLRLVTVTIPEIRPTRIPLQLREALQLPIKSRSTLGRSGIED